MIIMIIIMNKICKTKKRPELKALGRLIMIMCQGKHVTVDFNASYNKLYLGQQESGKMEELIW